MVLGNSSMNATLAMRVEQALADFEEMMMTNKFIGEYLKELCDKSPIFRLNGTERP